VFAAVLPIDVVAWFNSGRLGSKTDIKWATMRTTCKVPFGGKKKSISWKKGFTSRMVLSSKARLETEVKRLKKLGLPLKRFNMASMVPRLLVATGLSSFGLLLTQAIEPYLTVITCAERRYRRIRNSKTKRRLTPLLGQAFDGYSIEVAIGAAFLCAAFDIGIYSDRPEEPEEPPKKESENLVNLPLQDDGLLVNPEEQESQQDDKTAKEAREEGKETATAGEEKKAEVEEGERECNADATGNNEVPGGNDGHGMHAVERWLQLSPGAQAQFWAECGDVFATKHEQLETDTGAEVKIGFQRVQMSELVQRATEATVTQVADAAAWIATVPRASDTPKSLVKDANLLANQIVVSLNGKQGLADWTSKLNACARALQKLKLGVVSVPLSSVDALDKGVVESEG